MPKKKSNAEKNGLPRAVSKDRPKPRKAATGTVFQLKITLNDVKPPIWRRMQVGDCTLFRLHKIIQACMGWEDCHMWLLVIGDEEYGDDVMDAGGDRDFASARKAKLGQIIAQGIKKVGYEYDLGDSWRHTITVEKTLPAEAGVKYPRCIAGERACPPEDCGGPWGYPEFLEAIQNQKHKQHRELLEWVGGEFDPEAFDLGQVNEELQEVR